MYYYYYFLNERQCFTEVCCANIGGARLRETNGRAENDKRDKPSNSYQLVLMYSVGGTAGT